MLGYREGKFYIQDNGSKFGTLMLVRSGFTIKSLPFEHSYQIGKCVIDFSLKKPDSKCMPICSG